MRVWDEQSRVFVFETKTQLQIAHLNEHKERFEQTYGQAVEEYFLDYEDPYVYLNVCQDLQLQPREEAIHTPADLAAALARHSAW